MKSTIQKRTKWRKRASRFPKPNPDLMIKLSELLQGEREMIRVHSEAFDSDICFVNPALCDPSTLQTDCPVYTTRELAHILSLSPEEFQRFNDLKTSSVS
jgi:hypothetical protein